MTAIKPCPHCGSPAAIRQEPEQSLYAAYCKNSGCASTGRWSGTEEGAACWWNTRAPDPLVEELLTALERTHRELERACARADLMTDEAGEALCQGDTAIAKSKETK